MPALPNHPRGRTEIDDRAALASIMSGSTACAAKKLVLQIDGNPVVPIFRRHLERRMALIMRRIVDENLDPAKTRRGSC